MKQYTGCISCFGCKREQHKGHCVCHDGLTEVLDAIRDADGLIIGSPNYLGEMTASFLKFPENYEFEIAIAIGHKAVEQDSPLYGTNAA